MLRLSKRHIPFSPYFLHFYLFIEPKYIIKITTGISFSQKGEIILEIDSNHQSNSPGELNDPLTYYIMFIWSLIVLTDSENSDHFVSIELVTTLLMGKIHSTPPIKFHIDPSKHIPGINQNPMRK